MIVSITDVASVADLTLTPTSSTQDPSVITNGDYSAVYSDALSGSLKIQFDFANPQDIGYIALSGNFSTKDRIVISSLDASQPVELFSSDGDALFSAQGDRLNALYDNSIDDSTLGVNESRVMVYRPDISGSKQIEIEVFGSGQIVINQIAMGEYYEIPRGEQAGYKRPWSIPNRKGRTATSLNNSPIALVYESREIQATLNVPNNIMADYDGWYGFLQFATANTFYVLEDDDKFHAYAGFNAEPLETTAHPLTRDLGASSIKFNAFAKSSGVNL